jgi:hypothetical protein
LLGCTPEDFHDRIEFLSDDLLENAHVKRMQMHGHLFSDEPPQRYAGVSYGPSYKGGPPAHPSHSFAF